jgi:hypothetical protein
MEARTLQQHEFSRHGASLKSDGSGTSAATRSAACSVCGKLMLKSNLRAHMRARHKDKCEGSGPANVSLSEQFICLLCGIATKTSWIKVNLSKLPVPT